MQRCDRFVHILAILILPMFMACFQVDYSKTVTTCTAANPECPPGLFCQNEICVQRSDSDGAADSGVTTDLNKVDLAENPTLCPGGGDKPIGAARGCPGAFAAGKASQRCPAGWAICKTIAQVDPSICMNIASFFVSTQSGYWTGNTSNENCGAAIGNQLLFGCGAAGRSSKGTCGGMPRVVDVAGPWSASDGTVTTAALTDGAQGVLCCPP